MMRIIRIHADDNVAVAVSPLHVGEVIHLDGQNIQVQEDIPAGHKMAIRSFKEGEDVIKYGFPIGKARIAIQPGEWIHTHNLQSKLDGLQDYQYDPAKAAAWEPEKYNLENKNFWGYLRSDDRVGVRNEVWILPTVGCVNSVARAIESQTQELLTKHENLDGIVAYNHPYGCSQLDDDLRRTREFLAGLLHHPNAAAVLVLALGCENNTLEAMKKEIGPYDKARVKFIVCQDCEDEIKSGVEAVQELVQYATKFHRTIQPVSKLVVGLKCGGSDGLSGITANALIGQISNKVVAAGGTAILTEVPEMFGAETLLMNRAQNVETFHKIVQLINNFKSYFLRYGKRINENPSPGNKAGGITTLEDKSLGCVQKGGIAPITDVLPYGKYVRDDVKGLVLLEGPGNDLVAANALAAAGAQLILFTTGRGTPFAAPVPTVKIASNTQLATAKKNWIDFDAGRLLNDNNLVALSDEFWNFIIEVASGEKKVCAEQLDKHELVIFKDGVTL